MNLIRCSVRLGRAKHAKKHAWMHSWLAGWERESVEVVITLCEAGWSCVESWSWSGSTWEL